jgi:hypothetical protein
LAVTSEKRSPIEPDLPAIAEFLPGFDVISWTCLLHARRPAQGYRQIGCPISASRPWNILIWCDPSVSKVQPAWFTSMAEISAFRAGTAGEACAGDPRFRRAGWIEARPLPAARLICDKTPEFLLSETV